MSAKSGPGGRMRPVVMAAFVLAVLLLLAAVLLLAFRGCRVEPPPAGGGTARMAGSAALPGAGLGGAGAEGRGDAGPTRASHGGTFAASPAGQPQHGGLSPEAAPHGRAGEPRARSATGHGRPAATPLPADNAFRAEVRQIVEIAPGKWRVEVTFAYCSSRAFRITATHAMSGRELARTETGVIRGNLESKHLDLGVPENGLADLKVSVVNADTGQTVDTWSPGD